MKKKFLSVLLSLAMLLTLLPVSALAVDLTDEQKEALLEQGYTEEEIAELEENDRVMVITEDTELTEDFDGLILIMGSATVTITDAKVGLGVIVMTGVEDVKIVLAEGAEVNAVIALEKAEIVIEKDAKVNFVTVAASDTTVTVEGTVEQLTIDEAAANTEVNVAATGSVAAASINGTDTNFTAEDGASVGTVTVGENAAGTTITGEVEEVIDEAGNATVNGEPANTEDKDDEEDEEKEDKEKEDEPNFEAPVVPMPSKEPALDIKKADVDSSNYTVYDVTAMDGGTATNGAPIIDVKVITDMKAHAGSGGTKAWAGIAIPQIDASSADSSYKYTFVAIRGTDGTIAHQDWGSSYWKTQNNSGVVQIDGAAYDVFYFNAQNFGSVCAAGGTLQVIISDDYYGGTSGTINTQEKYQEALSHADYVLNLMVEYIDTTAQIAMLNDMSEDGEGFEDDETPSEEASAEDTPAEVTPAEVTPAEEAPTEVTPAEATPAEEAPAEVTPADAPANE